MINKQLETNVNNERLLERLAENLNVDFITDGSNIKKMADAYSTEQLAFASGVDTAIANGFTTTMGEEFLDLFGRQHNVYRKRFNNINIYAYQEIAHLTINRDDALITELSDSIIPFRAGTTLYSDSNIVIEVVSDVVVSDIIQKVPVSLRISLALGAESFIIPETASFLIPPTNQDLRTITPTYSLVFSRSVGLAIGEEFDADFRLRLFEATYVANNGANSIIASITKEVPLLYFVEVDDYKDDRAIRLIYPYTQEVVDTGFDDAIESHIIPLMESNLQNKIIYGQLIPILKPEPLLANVNLTFKEDVFISEAFLGNITLQFNRFFCTEKTLDKEIMSDFIRAELGQNALKLDKIDFIFNSPYVSEESFNLSDTSTNITLPRGRFIHLGAIRRAI